MRYYYYAAYTASLAAFPLTGIGILGATLGCVLAKAPNPLLLWAATSLVGTGRFRGMALFQPSVGAALMLAMIALPECLARGRITYVAR